jgi:hypothetical protein
MKFGRQAIGRAVRDRAAKGERSEILDHTGYPLAVVVPAPEPGHLLVTLDQAALAMLDKVRQDCAAADGGLYQHAHTAPAYPLADLRRALSGALGQLPDCLTCMDTGRIERPVFNRWLPCKCPAGEAATARTAHGERSSDPE